MESYERPWSMSAMMWCAMSITHSARQVQEPLGQVVQTGLAYELVA